MLSKMRSFTSIGKITIFTLLTISATSSHAAALTPMVSSNAWQFKVAPYLWAMSMSGTVQVATRRAHVNENFSDLWDHMDFGAMMYVDAKKDNFGY